MLGAVFAAAAGAGAGDGRGRDGPGWCGGTIYTTTCCRSIGVVGRVDGGGVWVVQSLREAVESRLVRVWVAAGHPEGLLQGGWRGG